MWLSIRDQEGSSEVAVLKSFVFSSYRIRYLQDREICYENLQKRFSLGGPDFFFCES